MRGARYNTGFVGNNASINGNDVPFSTSDANPGTLIYRRNTGSPLRTEMEERPDTCSTVQPREKEKTCLPRSGRARVTAVQLTANWLGFSFGAP